MRTRKRLPFSASTLRGEGVDSEAEIAQEGEREVALILRKGEGVPKKPKHFADILHGRPLRPKGLFPCGRAREAERGR